MPDLRICLLAAAVSIVGLMPPSAIAGPESSQGSAGAAFVKAPSGFRDACRRYAWLCSESAGSTHEFDSDKLLDLARSVNSRVNSTVSPLSDAENYGVPERWSLPANGRGDCEDYVLLKFQRLLEAGVNARQLSVAVVLNHQGENHAVLVLRHKGGDYVLDSLTARMRPWNETGYRFLAMQSSADPTAWKIVNRKSGDRHMIAWR